jgi:hypothetical protein
MTAEKICAKCIWWNIEPDILVKLPEAIKLQLEAFKTIYGKCRAEYMDNQGKFQLYDFGSLGGMRCIATDDNDKELFDEVPEN